MSGVYIVWVVADEARRRRKPRESNGFGRTDVLGSAGVRCVRPSRRAILCVRLQCCSRQSMISSIGRSVAYDQLGHDQRHQTFLNTRSSYVWPFKMGHNQAQEGRAGRQAGQDFHAPDQGNQHRGQEWRRSGYQSAAARRHRGRQSREHAGGQHQARHPARHRRIARRNLRRIFA